MPRRLVLASRVLFFLSGLLIAAGVVCIVAGVLDADEIAARLLERIMAEIDAEIPGPPPPGLPDLGHGPAGGAGPGPGLPAGGLRSAGDRHRPPSRRALVLRGGRGRGPVRGLHLRGHGRVHAGRDLDPAPGGHPAGRGWHRSGKRGRPVRSDCGPDRCRTPRARSQRGPCQRSPSRPPDRGHRRRLVYSATAATGPWCSGPTCLPVTQEIAGSNPVGPAIVPCSTRQPAAPIRAAAAP